jgi:hypothetical protein
VDGSTDKVYKYSGAASRLSGSQNAASSFSLAGGKKGDTNPQDIVTDGTSFWVVDGTQLKVFKYTLSGSSLGSWGIDPANTHPTGLTINPNAVSDVWIVDNGTDKVYQYVGAASRTSGSQNAGATFALAAGNTNPQGIADPPTADLTPATAPPALSQPSTPASTATGARPLASRDALFALLGGGSSPLPGTPSLHLAAPLGEEALTPGTSGRPSVLDDLVSSLAGSTQGLRSEGSVADPLARRLRQGGAWIDDGPASASANDSSAPAGD